MQTGTMLTPEVFRQIRRIEIRTRRLVDAGYAGAYLAAFKGMGMEFAEVRPYVAGDEIRSIDWNVTARTGQPYVKRFVEERELNVMLLFDASASGGFGSAGRMKRELGAELAAVLAFSAARNNDRVGLLAFTDQVELLVPPRKGRQHLLRLVRELLFFEPAGTQTDLPLALRAALNVLKRRSILIVVSDFLVDLAVCRRLLNQANRRHDVVAVDLNDRLEWRLPPAGLLTLEDVESGALHHVDSASPSWQAAYQEHARAQEMAKKALFESAQIDRIVAFTGEDYTAALDSFFRRRAQRRYR